MGQKKKVNPESHLTISNIAEIAEQMIALEDKNRKRWNKKPAVKRGEDMQEILTQRFPNLDDDAITFAMWVDLHIYIRDILTCDDESFAFMGIDEAIDALMRYETKNPEQFEYLLEWVGDFGCLLTEGVASDLGGWFHDWIPDLVIFVGALDYESNLHLENPSKAELAKLAKSKVVRDRVLAALHTGTSEEILTSLAQDQTTVVRFAVAKNSSTPEDVLDELSRDPEEPVRQAAPANESISTESLKSTESGEGKVRLASSKKTTAEALAKLAKEKDEEIRMAVAENLNTNAETLLVLAKDKSEDVREKIAENPNTPLEAIKTLVRDKVDLVRWSVASREDLTEEMFKTLSKDKFSWVRRTIAENKKTPAEILKLLSKDLDSSVREAVFGNQNVAHEIVADIENSPTVKLALAGNASTPIEILVKFSVDETPIYYQGSTRTLSAAVAGNRSIPESIVLKLIKSKNSSVIQELAANPAVPQKHLDELVERSLKKGEAGNWDWNERDLELGLARNPKVQAKYLVQLLKHSDSWVVSEVAKHPNLPPMEIAKLGKSSEENVIQGVCANPSAPWALLKSLLGEAGNLWFLASNPALKGEDLIELTSRLTTIKAIFSSDLILADVAENPSAPSELIKKLAKNKDEWIRFRVACNPSTSNATRIKILEDFLNSVSEDNKGEELLARCIFSPGEMLEEVASRFKLAFAPNREQVLRSLGANPNTPAEVLSMLASDWSTEVRIAVAGNPSTPVEALIQLSK